MFDNTLRLVYAMMCSKVRFKSIETILKSGYSTAYQQSTKKKL